MKSQFVCLALIFGLAATPAPVQEVREYGSTSRGRIPDSSTRMLAQDAVRRVGIDCQVMAAMALGSDVNGVPQYEVTCEDGPGYILVGAPVDEAIDCLALASPTRSEGRRVSRSRTCRLPGNRNTITILARMARQAGMGCRVDEGALVGVSPDRVPIYEIGCARSAGGWIEHTRSGWRVTDCMTIEAQGNSCRFTSPNEQMVLFRDRLPASALSVCNPVGARYMGQGPSGSFYEADCGGNRGVVVAFNEAGEFQEIIPCVEAGQVGDGCGSGRTVPIRPTP